MKRTCSVSHTEFSNLHFAYGKLGRKPKRAERVIEKQIEREHEEREREKLYTQTVGLKFFYFIFIYITQSIERDEQKRKPVNVRIYFQMKVIEYNERNCRQ